jgi:hypothetical protein
MKNLPTNLPIPSVDTLAHSEQLTLLIRHEIAAADGCITFAKFMELALYAPGLGYYSAGCLKLGKAGDFVTFKQGLKCVWNVKKPISNHYNFK